MNKQIIVTISIIKVKLLTLLQVAWKEIYIRQLLQELDVRLDSEKMIIQCDNQQMLQLVKTEIGKLNIKLKHINIHNHWLCQEYQKDHIFVYYVELKSIIVNDLMKTFLLDNHCWFLAQIKLINIRDHLLDCWNKEAAEFEILELLDIK